MAQHSKSSGAGEDNPESCEGCLGCVSSQAVPWQEKPCSSCLQGLTVPGGSLGLAPVGSRCWRGRTRPTRQQRSQASCRGMDGWMPRAVCSSLSSCCPCPALPGTAPISQTQNYLWPGETINSRIISNPATAWRCLLPLSAPCPPFLPQD